MNTTSIAPIIYRILTPESGTVDHFDRCDPDFFSKWVAGVSGVVVVRPKHSNWLQVKAATNTPGIFTISPGRTSRPHSGARFAMYKLKPRPDWLLFSSGSESLAALQAAMRNRVSDFYTCSGSLLIRAIVYRRCGNYHGVLDYIQRLREHAPTIGNFEPPYRTDYLKHMGDATHMPPADPVVFLN